MFRIHNRRLFWRLAGRSIRANLSRHLLTALAVFLSTVMLFSIFTIGVNYFRNLPSCTPRPRSSMSRFSLPPGWR